LLWRQEKLLEFFSQFEKSLDIYLDNRRYCHENGPVQREEFQPEVETT
jgi:hypothetical protein